MTTAVRTSAAIPLKRGIEVRNELVSPAQAKAWLEGRLPNRRVSPSTVAKLARDMIGGRFVPNGETIKLNEAGRLLDGQHRLEGVVQAGIPVLMTIARNVPDEAMPTIDAGRARTFGDVVAIRGGANSNVVASAAQWLARYEQGSITSQHALSHSELDDVLARHPRLGESTKKAGVAGKIIPPGMLAFVHYVASGKDEAMADEFVTMVQTGTASDGSGLASEHPAFRLRERFIAQKGSKLKIARIERMAVLIRAWNLYRAGRSIKILRWRSSGPAAEPFPDFE